MDEQPLLHPPLKKFGFIHVPKCAGRSIRAAVMPFYPRNEVFGDDGRPALSGSWAGVSCILEHVPYRHMMDISNMVFATVLRHPVDVEQSFINYLHRRREENRLESRYRLWLAAAEDDLDRYIETHITDGKMLDYFWTDPNSQDESAANIIRYLDLVGFQDDFSGFVHRLSRLLGLDIPVLYVNTSPVVFSFTPAQRARVAWKTRRDCAFYRYARSLWAGVDDQYQI